MENPNSLMETVSRRLTAPTFDDLCQMQEQIARATAGVTRILPQAIGALRNDVVRATGGPVSIHPVSKYAVAMVTDCRWLQSLDSSLLIAGHGLSAEPCPTDKVCSALYGLMDKDGCGRRLMAIAVSSISQEFSGFLRHEQRLAAFGRRTRVGEDHKLRVGLSLVWNDICKTVPAGWEEGQRWRDPLGVEVVIEHSRLNLHWNFEMLNKRPKRLMGQLPDNPCRWAPKPVSPLELAEKEHEAHATV